MKNKIFNFLLMIFALVCLITCDNPIMKTWWEEEEPEPEYIPITKMVPQVSYETIIEHDFIYKEIFIQLPPETIYETIIEHDTLTIYETIIEKVPEYIYETIVEYVTQTKVEYVEIHDEIIVEVEKIVPAPATEADIIEYIKNHPAEVIEIIKEQNNWKEILKEIIKDIPPDEIVTYLTDEQIKYIIQQQPPQIILQTITIIDIEYIIFAGNSNDYNGPAVKPATTNLTSEEKSSNQKSVDAIAQALLDHPDYLIMLHGHANPVNFTDGETVELMQLSMERAKSVETVLRNSFKAKNGGTGIDDTRVSVSGYGGEKNLFGTNSTYAGLNRRVEMILIRVGI